MNFNLPEVPNQTPAMKSIGGDGFAAEDGVDHDAADNSAGAPKKV